MRSPFHATLLGATLLGGCATSPAAVTSDIPAWLRRPPSEVFKRTCAVGRAGATLYREAARETAAESARANLAKAQEVHIRSRHVDEQVSRNESASSSGAGQTIVQVTEMTHESVVRNTDILDFWYDAAGALTGGGEKRVTYAVACLR